MAGSLQGTRLEGPRSGCAMLATVLPNERAQELHEQFVRELAESRHFRGVEPEPGAGILDEVA